MNGIKYYHGICMVFLMYYQENHALFQLNVNFFNIAIGLFDDGHDKLKLSLGITIDGKKLFNVPCAVGIAYENRSDTLLHNIFASLSLYHYTSRFYKPEHTESDNANKKTLLIAQALSIVRTLHLKSSLSGDSMRISYIPDTRSSDIQTFSFPTMSQQNKIIQGAPIVKTIFDNPALYIPYFFNYYANLGFSITKKNNEWDMYFHNADGAALKFKGSIFKTEFIKIYMDGKHLENYFARNPHKLYALLLSFMGNAAVYGWQEAGKEIANERERAVSSQHSNIAFGALSKYLEKSNRAQTRL